MNFVPLCDCFGRCPQRTKVRPRTERLYDAPPQRTERTEYGGPWLCNNVSCCSLRSWSCCSARSLCAMMQRSEHLALSTTWGIDAKLEPTSRPLKTLSVAGGADLETAMVSDKLPDTEQEPWPDEPHTEQEPWPAEWSSNHLCQNINLSSNRQC